MPRATNNVAAHRRHKKYLRRAKGNYGARSRLYRTARETVQKGLTYAGANFTRESIVEDLNRGLYFGLFFM